MTTGRTAASCDRARKSACADDRDGRAGDRELEALGRPRAHREAVDELGWWNPNELSQVINAS